MKAQILKIAGVKTEAEFYRKFPSEEAFMKKHSKELKKAQDGIAVQNQKQQAIQKPLLYNDLYKNALSTVTGINEDDLDDQQQLQNQQPSNQPEGIAGMFGQMAGIAGKMLSEPKAQVGIQLDGSMSKPFQGMPNKFNKFNVPQTLELDTDISQNPYMNGSMLGGKKNQSYMNVGSSDDSGSYDLKGKLKNAGLSLLGSAGSLISSFQQLEQDKKDIVKAKQSADISQIVGQAAASRPEPVKNKYVRPEDALLTNPMAKGKIGAGVFKKGGKVKGGLPTAAGGINLDSYAGFAGTLGGALGSATGKGTRKGGPASQIGSTLGGIAGSFIPIPGVGTALGSLAGGFIGGMFDAKGQREKQDQEGRLQRNLESTAMSNGARSLQMQNSGFMENGGYMNPEYNPQVIAKFGDYDVDQLFRSPYDADMLRSGGHLAQVDYTPPSARAMYTGRDLPYQMENGGQMAMGGDLQVHRGEAETMSYNPYLPDGGETIMFRGPSHDNGGMPVSFGQNGVEVEGGEPAIKMQDGGEEGNLVVYGNMVIPEYGAMEIGDKEAKGKKFKHYVADLSKTEAKQNKLVDKTMLMLDDVDENDAFDQLILNVGQANLIGANMKLKSIAEKKKSAASVQNAILDTASEMGVESDALAKGRIKYAKANDPYAEFGAKLDKFKPGGKKGKKAAAPLSALQSFIKEIKYPERAQMAKVMGIPNYTGTAEQNQFLLNKTQTSDIRPPALMPTNSLTPDVARLAMDKSIKSEDYKTGTEPSLTEDQEKTNWWEVGMDTLSSAMPFLRPSNQIPLDASQLQGEMYAMANNQEEPVYAQTYNPLLSQTTNISLQDQLNEITSQSRAAERMAQGNPAALAMIASQAAEAKNKVLGEQFRLNQGEQMRVAETNRQTMNDAQLKNLAIFDQQQQRQAQAKSNTKQQTITALNSISDKIAKNKLSNRELSISENLYNYRFTPNGVAYNINAPQSFAPYGSGPGAGQVPTGMTPDYEADESGKAKVVGYKFPKETKTKKRNGSIVSAIKNL